MFSQIFTTGNSTLNEPNMFLCHVLRKKDSKSLSKSRTKKIGQRQTGKLVPRPDPCVRAYVRTYGRTDGHDVITKFSRLDG